VALSNSDGSLNPTILYSLPNSATGSGLGTVLGDMNNDGFADVVVGGYTPAASQVFLNNSDGTFQSPVHTLSASFTKTRLLVTSIAMAFWT